MSSFNPRVSLINSLCRICGKEEKNYISVFSESGKRQEIEKKIRLCLPLTVEEGDTLPKQICLVCLHKLDATWELLQLCKEGQVLIEQKLYYISENNNREKNLFKINMIDEKVRSLSEDRPITIGDSAVITLVPVQEPLPQEEAPPPTGTSEGVVGMVPTYQVPAPATSTAPTTMPSTSAVESNVYPQGLIQVLQPNKPVLYQQRSNDVKPTQPLRRNNVTPIKRPMPAPRPNNVARRSLPTTSRRASKQENSPIVPAPKKVLMMCKYCKKSFPDEIIDHHVSLHLRQSFSTCLDCNKNFRSEIAMSRHRCGTSDTTNDISSDTPINLDPDDDLICL